ncbi:hypothetical protein NX059_002146 [Plenodomus lindquistii]|nr:hypothetical protein NX059_002146 [Plenodomus lindquistii]
MSNRYPRDRSPPYRDRRPSTFSNGYPPRAGDSVRPNPEPSAFPPREIPRGPKSVVDTSRGPPTGPPTPLRTAPPLSSGPAPPLHNSHNSWRADRDRDRDFDRRERRPTPPRRSPIRDVRDPRDQRDFLPRDLDVNRARRNSRDGPSSAGSTYSDAPPIGAGSSYRGGGSISRGRGGFAGRGRNFHGDDRDRHHDPRDRPPDRTYRPRSRTPPGRRERDVREERDFDRRDRDDRRFIPREYDSYIGPAGAAKPGLRNLDTHRGSASSDLRHLPGTPTGPTPHSSHHASPSDRLGSQVDSYSRRSSLAIEPLSTKGREPGKDEALLASRAEASRERYAPRASSPPASIPAFGGSNVWRAPIPETKASASTASQPKPLQSVPVPNPTPVISAAPTPNPATAQTPVVPTLVASTAPKTVVATPASKVPVAPPAPKTVIPSGPSILPPTGPKADRISDRVLGEASSQDSRPGPSVTSRIEPLSQPPPAAPTPATDNASTHIAPPKAPTAPTAPTSSLAPSSVGPFVSAPTAPSGLARSPPQGPAFKPRAPPIAPQAAFRANASPSFSRATLPPYSSRDPSPGATPPIGPRSGNVHNPAINTSPQTLPANIPTGPKADRAPMASRPSSMYPPPDRPGFAAPRGMSGGPKSMQWVRPGLIPARPMIPTKREFPTDDRDRQFGTTPKAPRLENSVSAMQPQREQAKSVSPSIPKVSAETARPRERAASAERSSATSPKPTPIETRRYSDVVMAEASPRITGPPMSTTSSAPEVLQDSDDDLDLDEEDFAESEAKYNREVARLEAKRIDLSAPHLRATTPLQEIVLLSCLTVDHLPQKQMESKLNTEDEAVPMHQDYDNTSQLDQQRPESIIADLPTPKDDRSDDVEIGENLERDDKLDRPTAPATVALRLRREGSLNDETFPDLSSLPYLGSGPPTPLSDIGQDRPSLSDSIRLAMCEKLRKSIEPELSQDEKLRQYAAVYKQWRIAIRPWDEERELDDPERQPSAEPALKALTPDVQSAAMTGILDGSLAPTGRRGHASRWATELDIEAVIAESLKTAEEEKLGKKDKEPRKSMADPEKEADLPVELTDSEAQRRRYIDTNFQREPGQGIFAFHYEPPEDDFTEEEHRVMVHNYKDQFAKKWGKLAEVLYKEVGTERTYKDCINHYYATKWGREYKGKLRGKRAGPKKRGGAVARARAAIANMERPEQSGEDGQPLPVTETGRPRRSAAPTFGGTEQDIDPNAAAPLPGRARRQTDADGTQEKAGRRGKGKDKIGRKAKNMPLAAAPVGSPVKFDRKEKSQGLAVKLEDEFNKRPLGEMPLPIHPGLIEEQMLMAGNQQILAELPPGMLDRSKLPVPPARPGPSSYWSVSELQDFDKNVAHFGTDWLAIANHMGTKTHTMIKNQYLRLVESGRIELEQMAKEADARRERGDELGPPPTPTPAPKRRYESTQATPIRQIAPTPEHKSPLLNQVTLPKAASPHSASSSRFSTIAQAPVPSKPSLPSSGFSSLAEPSLVSVPSMPSQQSPPAPPQRAQPQHHHQHSMSQHKPPPHAPRSGYFSDDMPPRHENRPTSQLPASSQPPRHLQQHVQSQGRSQEQHQSPLYRSVPFLDRENISRPSGQQEQDAQHRFHHQRRISHELQNARAFVPGQPTLIPTVRSNSDLRSPEHRPLSYSHSRHVSQAQSIGHSPADVYGQGPASMSKAQQVPQRSTILTPPVKEEPRNPPPFMPQNQHAQAPPQPMLHSQHQHQQLNPTSVPKGPPPGPPKPVVEPRKSNLMSLLNDTPPEEPRRKKPNDQGPPSHNTTPQQSTPIAPPPPTSQPYSSSSRRSMFDDQGVTQSTYSRPSYAQQSALPPATTPRSIDLANEQSGGGRPREGWTQRPPYLHGHSHSQHSVSLPSSQPGPQQPPFNENRMFGNHRSVFAQHNATRHNPSPPPHGYTNSPHMHSRTPSISGVSAQASRHAIPSTTAGQHSQGASASALVLQPNPYAQVDPPGSAPPPGPIGMRPSPHPHTSHIAQQRDASVRNEHSQTQNANLSYSNPQTPNEHPGHPQLGAPRGLNEPYRPRDLRDPHRDLESRNSDRDTGRELAQRTEYLHEQLSNPTMRSAGPPMHENMRFQPQDRPYLPQRSQTPLSRPEHSQTPQLQHPPHSSLGVANQPIYGQRSHDEPTHRFQQPSYSHDRIMADRARDEQAQQAQHQAVMERDEHMRRERDRDIGERERQLQDARYRENFMRNREIRGQPPPGSGTEQRPDPRAPTGPGPMDWTRHQQDRGGWQR